MMDIWLKLFFPRAVTRADLGNLGGNPRFRAPRRDIASEIAQGGSGLAVSATELSIGDRDHG